MKVYRCGGTHWRAGHGGDCAGWWAECGCGWSAEYGHSKRARWAAAQHEGGHEVEDRKLERWIDWTLESVAWYEERAQAEEAELRA